MPKDRDDNTHSDINNVASNAADVSKSTDSVAPMNKREVVLSAINDLNSAIGRITNGEELDKATLHIMDTLPESVRLQDLISEARTNGNTTSEDELVARQKAIYLDIHEELALVAGIETDEARVKRENEEYRTRVASLFEGEDINDLESGDILQRLGMLQTAKDGSLVFTFPKEIFPPHICEKWDHYIDIVARYVHAERKRKEGEDDIRMITQLDVIRTQAHNNLSLVIKDFLNLEGWELPDCRNLVVKMREAKLPNIETAEKETTAAEIARLIAMIRSLREPTS